MKYFRTNFKQSQIDQSIVYQISISNVLYIQNVNACEILYETPMQYEIKLSVRIVHFILLIFLWNDYS